ncbi:MAG: asparagine synthase (glutamine-hydrolyzing) [Cyclobacteriaceae bacterium]
MCGIHLIVDKQQRLDQQAESIIKKMTNRTRHRGPDAEGSYSHRGDHQDVYLSANRLRIMDANARSDQPMQSEDGRYQLIFNGAIYNYFELRNGLLNQGVRFRTQSDTEVLLHLLIRQGESALARLNGMFALIFFDRQEQRLLAARDRYGMKPLYFFENEAYLLMSSETAALLESGLVEKQLNTAALHDYMSLRYVREPHTFFQDISQLAAGHFMEIDNKGSSRISAFAKPPASAGDLSEREILDKTDELLTDAVLRHLQADVKSGLFLSGGVDSSLLLAIIKEQGAHPVPTFSVTNAEGESTYGTEDYKYAAKAAQQYGSYHYELPLQAGLLQEHWDDFISATDQPVGDGAAFLTYLLSAEVKKVAGIALSGAGADELFGGYHRHQAFSFYLRHYRSLQQLAPLLRGGRKLLPVSFAHPLRKRFLLLQKLGKNLHASPDQTFGNFLSVPLPNIRAIQADLGIELMDVQDKRFEETWLSAALRHDLQHYLREDVLHLSDRMSMGRHLEMRLPYLDLPLAQWAESLRATQRLKHGRKWILRRLLEEKGGKIYARRPKEGFGMPLGQWLRQEQTKGLREGLLRRDQYLYEFVDPQAVWQMLEAHLRRKEDFSLQLWSMLTLSAWLQRYFS